MLSSPTHAQGPNFLPFKLYFLFDSSYYTQSNWIGNLNAIYPKKIWIIKGDYIDNVFIINNIYYKKNIKILIEYLPFFQPIWRNFGSYYRCNIWLAPYSRAALKTRFPLIIRPFHKRMWGHEVLGNEVLEQNNWFFGVP